MWGKDDTIRFMIKAAAGSTVREHLQPGEERDYAFVHPTLGSFVIRLTDHSITLPILPALGIEEPLTAPAYLKEGHLYPGTPQCEANAAARIQHLEMEREMLQQNRASLNRPDTGL